MRLRQPLELPQSRRQTAGATPTRIIGGLDQTGFLSVPRQHAGNTHRSFLLALIVCVRATHG